MSDEYFDEFMAERKLRHDAEARIAQLEAALAECQKVRDQWCKEFTEQRDDAEALVKRCAALETEADPDRHKWENTTAATKERAGSVFRSEPGREVMMYLVFFIGFLVGLAAPFIMRAIIGDGYTWW